MAVPERETACRIRMLSEERGLAAASADHFPRSALGFLLEEVGVERFFERMAELGDALVLDTRVIEAHMGVSPSREDRFQSDLMNWEAIEEPFLRRFTQGATNAPRPVLLGGHSLVAGVSWPSTMSPGPRMTAALASRRPSPFSVNHPYLGLTDDELLRQCSVETFRASGPGGQHRNKTDSAVRLRHNPTGIVAQAYERRSQHENKAVALRRLREAIALEVRQPVDVERYETPLELAALLSSAGRQRIGPKNERYWPGIAALLDLFVALDCSVSDTARHLGVSTGALSRLLLDSPPVTAKANELRTARGMRPLR
jgi:hypothetical protein